MLALAFLAACGGGSALPEIADGSAEVEGATVSYIVDDDRFLGGSLSVEIVAPKSGGPWPTVVMFHGNGGSPDDLRAEARKIASRGRVVFNASWQRVVSTDDAAALADLYNRQAACAVAFAREQAAEYGGDPEHLTLFGYSAGANVATMVAFGNPEPLDTCSAGSAGSVSALVMLDPPLLLADEWWDGPLEDDPDLFYVLTPWRLLDEGPDIPIYLLVTDSPGLGRSLEDTAWVTRRHTDTDLLVSLGAPVTVDGFLSLPETVAWARDRLEASGHDVTMITLPDSTHIIWSAEARQIIWDTVVGAEGR